MRQRLVLTVAFAVVGMIGGATGQALAANPFPPTAFWQTNGTVRAIAFRGNVVYVGGEFTSVRPPGAAAGTKEVARHNVAAFNTKTGAVLKWNPGANGTVRTIVATSTRIYLGGSFTTVGGRARSNVAAVSLGGVASQWNPGANRSVFVLRLGPNGRLFAGGDFTKIGGKVRQHLAEIGRSASAPVAAWGPAIGQITGFACPPRCSPRIFTISFLANGHRVYFGGHFGLVDGVARNEAAAVPIDNSSQVLAFNPNIYAAANCPTCTTVETSRVYRIIATAVAHLHVRRLLEGQRRQDLVQRQRLRSEHRHAAELAHPAGRRRHAGLPVARGGAVRRRPLQRGRARVYARAPHAVLDAASRGGVRHDR